MPTGIIWTVLVCALTVALTVLLHYEGLRLISDRLIPRLRVHPRHALLYVIFGVFIVHSLEIGVFAGAYAVLVNAELGRFYGHVDGTALDYLYFSAATYTSLGLGDVYPYGALRPLTGAEALTGLLMIGWSASYTYLCMEGLWKEHAERRAPRRRG